MFATIFGIELMSKFTPGAYRLASQAYSFMEQAGQGQYCLEQMKLTLEAGDTLPWARNIIKYFRKKTVGGASYSKGA